MTLNSILKEEILNAQAECREFSFSVATKKKLIREYGVPKIAKELIKCIRRYKVEIANDDCNMTKLESSGKLILRSLPRLSKNVTWTYKEDSEPIIFESGETALLIPSSMSLQMSTILNGKARYTTKISHHPTPNDNWNNDEMLRKAIVYICTNPTKLEREALSQNRIRVFCLQGNGCRYPTAFPIPVAVWIYRLQAKELGKSLKILDPCAGWGDRLAGAKLAGIGTCKEYIGIDPWRTAIDTCKKVEKACRIFSDCKISLKRARAEDPDSKWPDVDLVFTSPPYGALEKYGLDDEDNSSQAWTLVEDSEFICKFLLPLMKKSALATKKNSGRVIINIGNNPSARDETSRLTSAIIDCAVEAGLEYVSTIGMALSVRAPKTSHTNIPSARGEPCFIFQHPK